MKHFLFILLISWTSLFCASAQTDSPEQKQESSATQRQNLPKLHNDPVAVMPFDAKQDAFGLPVRWLFQLVYPKGSGSEGAFVAAPGTLIDFISRLPIKHVVPGKEVQIDSTTMPLYGIFIVKDGDKKYKLKIEQITQTEVLFSAGKDNTLYRYLVPVDTLSSSSAVEEETAKKAILNKNLSINPPPPPAPDVSANVEVLLQAPPPEKEKKSEEAKPAEKKEEPKEPAHP